MDISTALVEGVSALMADLDQPRPSLLDALKALNRDAKRALRSYLGLQLLMGDADQVITLTSMSPVASVPVSASLCLPLSAIGSSGRSSDVIIFFADNPGAFVDLAADLTYAFGLAAPVIVLDAHQPSTLVSGLAGVEDAATIDRAIGALIERGHHPDRALGRLRELATASRVGVAAYAAAMW